VPKEAKEKMVGQDESSERRREEKGLRAGKEWAKLRRRTHKRWVGWRMEWGAGSTEKGKS